MCYAITLSIKAANKHMRSDKIKLRCFAMQLCLPVMHDVRASRPSVRQGDVDTGMDKVQQIQAVF